MEKTEEIQSETEPTGATFHIDPAHAQLKIRELPLSKRATTALVRMGVQKLGELDGFACDKLLQLKNCGSKTCNEIIRLVEQYAPNRSSPPANSKAATLSDSERLVVIPEFARNWPIRELPLSVRLDHVLQKLNCRTLNDLHDMAYHTLLDVPNCGMRTLVELEQLVVQIERGEFSLSSKDSDKTPVVCLVERIDATLAQLSPKYRQIFLERLGGTAQPLTLAEVGKKFNITRERVRQIVDMLITRVKRSGGPAFMQALQALAEELNRQVWPLTPQLFKELLVEKQAPTTYHPAFYIRLLGWLSPDLSTWPVGQTPTALRTPELERILEQIKKWFEGRKEVAAFAEVYQGIQGEGFSCTSSKFMEALRYAAEFEIVLDVPKKPGVRPPVDFPRRWAQVVLMQEQDPLTAREAVTRARAIVQARRAPRSDYRLIRST